MLIVAVERSQKICGGAGSPLLEAPRAGRVALLGRSWGLLWGLGLGWRGVVVVGNRGGGRDWWRVGGVGKVLGMLIVIEDGDVDGVVDCDVHGDGEVDCDVDDDGDVNDDVHVEVK